MSDLPVSGVEKKEVPLTTDQRFVRIEKDIQELARGINLQGSLLESMIIAFDHVVKKYMELIRVPEEKKDAETPKE